jgi:hypothetical protein
MASELGLLSLTQLQKLAQSQQNNQSSWMWHPKQIQEDDDDSWEVRAFAEDTGNIMGTTWPPRSYTCTFCRREFGSAQAVGGHMIVHRRDRARLHHRQPPNSSSSAVQASASSSSALIISSEEFTGINGLCLLYPIQNPNEPTSVFAPSAPPYALQQPVNYQVMPRGYDQTTTQSTNYNYSQNEDSFDSNNNVNNECKDIDDHSAIEELDLELRLGHRPETS